MGHSATDILIIFDTGGHMPGISINRQSMSFGDEALGHMSDSMPFIVSGASLKNNIVIAVGDGFIINSDDSNTNASPMTLIQSGGIVNATTIFVKFNPQLQQSYTDSVDVMSTGATTKSVRLTGNATTPSVYASLFSIVGLQYDGSQGPSSASTTFNIIGISLSPAAGNVTVTPSSNIEVFDGTSWQSSAFTISYTGSALSTSSIYKVRLKNGLVPDDYNFESVDLSGGGAPVFSISVRGIVNTPTITLSETTFSFPQLNLKNYYVQFPDYTYTVEAHALYGNLTITKPIGYIINKDGSITDSGIITLIPDGSGDISSTTIHVKFLTQFGGTYNGNVANAALNATTKNIAVSGTAVKSFAMDLYSYYHR